MKVWFRSSEDRFSITVSYFVLYTIFFTCIWNETNSRLWLSLYSSVSHDTKLYLDIFPTASLSTILYPFQLSKLKRDYDRLNKRHSKQAKDTERDKDKSNAELQDSMTQVNRLSSKLEVNTPVVCLCRLWFGIQRK